MRYFISRIGATVVDKVGIEGDTLRIDAAIANYKAKNPTYTVTEVDVTTSDATPIVPAITAEQSAWLTAKSAGGAAALSFLGKKEGLE